METLRPYARIGVLAVVAFAILAAAQVVGPRAEVATAASGGIQDAGGLTLQTHEKLDEVNANLKELNGKLQAILDLLKSGKLQVVTGQAAPTPAAKPAEAER